MFLPQAEGWERAPALPALLSCTGALRGAGMVLPWEINDCFFYRRLAAVETLVMSLASEMQGREE